MVSNCPVACTARYEMAGPTKQGVIMKHLATAVISGACLAVAFTAVQPAHAADQMIADYGSATPWYVEGLLGGAIPRDYDFTFQPAGPVGTYDPDGGFGFMVGVGKYFTENVRADVTAAFAWGTDGAVTLPGPVVVPHTGTIGAYTFLGNIYYEFTDVAPQITPWVGIGAGFTVFDYNNLGGAGFQYNDSDIAFTAAAHLGVDYAMTDKLDLTARYTLSWTGEHSVSATTAGPVPITADDQINNSFGIGLRYKFGN